MSLTCPSEEGGHSVRGPRPGLPSLHSTCLSPDTEALPAPHSAESTENWHWKRHLINAQQMERCSRRGVPFSTTKKNLRMGKKIPSAFWRPSPLSPSWESRSTFTHLNVTWESLQPDLYFHWAPKYLPHRKPLWGQGAWPKILSKILHFPLYQIIHTDKGLTNVENGHLHSELHTC